MHFYAFFKQKDPSKHFSWHPSLKKARCKTLVIKTKVRKIFVFKSFVSLFLLAYRTKEMQPKLIVITGGPGTGKTTLINRLITAGHVCYPEISREITEDARKNGIDQLFLNNSLLFSELLLEGRKKQFEAATNEKAPLVFLDRGLPDIIAYMHYIGDSFPDSFTAICTALRYSKVFVLPPWEAIYTPDEYRYENFEQANLIFNYLKETYTHFGYNWVELPKDTIDNRILFILDEISKE